MSVSSMINVVTKVPVARLRYIQYFYPGMPAAENVAVIDNLSQAKTEICLSLLSFFYQGSLHDRKHSLVFSFSCPPDLNEPSGHGNLLSPVSPVCLRYIEQGGS